MEQLGSRPATAITDEAERLTQAALAANLPIRLLGGLAIWLRSPSVRRPPYARPYRDLDFIAAAADRLGVQGFLESAGYLPDRRFNTLYGAQRLYYAAPDGAWNIDVIFDRLAMSHTLDLRERLTRPEPTIPLADLLLSKLQIWEINHKDLGDALCLLADHPLGATGIETIELGRLRSILAHDWGFCHTVERNLQRVGELWADQPLEMASFDVAGQVTTLAQVIEASPKSLAWKARARVGERVRWYDTPEEVRQD